VWCGAKRCRDTQEGIAKLSTDGDYSQLVKRVNVNHPPMLVVTYYLVRLSSARSIFVMQMSKIISL
jgi:hypothetical protein